MTITMNDVISAAAENLDKVDSTVYRSPDCKFGDCKDVDCCFNICKSIVINICGSKTD